MVGQHLELINYIDTKLLDSAQKLLLAYRINDEASIQKKIEEIQAWLELKNLLNDLRNLTH